MQNHPLPTPSQDHLARLTLDRTRDLVFWVRPDGSFAYVNPAVLNLLGYTRTQMAGLNAATILTDYSEEDRQRLRNEMKIGVPLVVRASVVRRDGTTVPVEAENFLVDTPTGPVNCAVCRDLSAELGRRPSGVTPQPTENAPFAVADRLNIVGVSRRLRAALAQAKRMARSDRPALITGESGVGKEAMARYVHAHGNRADKPLEILNCACLGENDLIRQLFGHKRGAYTGATSDRAGLFATANGGALFLDEVGELPLSVQAALLRVLQQGTFRPMGSDRTASTDVRLIAATNRDLRAMVAVGTFRADLYHRLAVLRLRLPPLRERQEDIRPLVLYYLGRLNAEYGTAFAPPGKSCFARLKAHPFPATSANSSQSSTALTATPRATASSSVPNTSTP